MLGDVADVNPRLRASLEPDQPVSFLGMADASDDGTTTAGVDRPFDDVRRGFTPFESGDILVAKITPCFQNGKIVQATTARPHGFGSTEFHVVRSKNDQLDHRYGLHFLRQAWIRIDGERRMTGSGGQRRVPADFLKSLTIPLPSIPEQRRIAAILDHADALRAKRREALARLDELTQSIFIDMFGDPVANNRNWTAGTVGDFVDRFEGGRNIVGSDDPDDGYRVLKVSAVTSLSYRESESKPLPAGYVPPANHLVQPGDLLFSRANTSELVGATALVTDTDGRTALPDKLWRFKWKDEHAAAPGYVAALFQRPSFRRKVSDRATGSSGSMKNIAQSKVLSIPVGIPPADLQWEFESSRTAIETVKAHHRVALAELDALFAALQSRAFRGEL